MVSVGFTDFGKKLSTTLWLPGFTFNALRM